MALFCLHLLHIRAEFNLNYECYWPVNHSHLAKRIKSVRLTRKLIFYLTHFGWTGWMIAWFKWTKLTKHLFHRHINEENDQKNAEPIHSKHCRMKGMLLSISENHHVNEASTAQTNWKLCQFISEPFSKIARKHVLYEIKHVISKHDILNVWLRNSMWWNEWVFSLILCVLGPRCPYVTVNIACSIHFIRCNTVKIKSYSFVGAVAWKFGHFQKAFDKRNWCFRNTNRITELNGMILTSSTMCVIKD